MSAHLTAPVTGNDHALGQLDAPLVLVQYGDYECPYTRRSLREVEKVRVDLGTALLWVFRNFPLTEIHPHAYKRPKRGGPRRVLGDARHALRTSEGANGLRHDGPYSGSALLGALRATSGET